jgi:hypothetical protein
MFAGKNILKKGLIVFLFFCIHFSCSKSGSSPDPQDTRDNIDELLEEAFAAIKNRDLAKYYKLTITSADFVLKQMGISKFKEKQSYVGSSLKPGEINKQIAQFNRAQQVEEKFEDKMIYFDKDTYVSPGKIVDRGILTVVNNVQIPYKIYTVKIKSESGEVLDDLYPYFMIVQWGGTPRILELIFPTPAG